MGTLSKADSKIANTTKTTTVTQCWMNENGSVTGAPQPRLAITAMIASVSEGRKPASVPSPNILPMSATQLMRAAPSMHGLYVGGQRAGAARSPTSPPPSLEPSTAAGSARDQPSRANCLRPSS